VPIDLSSLNDKQKEAVLHDEGPLLVVAGAGSGKTRTVAFRIVRLIAEKKAKPYEILAVTFTNKAAKELKERITDLLYTTGNLNPNDGEVQACTFHRFCVQLLRRYADLSGKFNRFFQIYDRDDGEKIIKAILKEKNWEKDGWTPGRYLSAFSDVKNEVSDPETLSVRFPKNEEIFEVFTEYQKRLRKANVLDLDDLLSESYRLLASHEQVRGYFQRLYKFIHVDEYQDTNRVQFLLLKLLVGNQRNVYAVGDTDQAIYGWRGADIRNILEFEKDFHPAHTILLEQNYRSTPGILRIANEVIEHNRQRKPKNLWTKLGEGERIRLLHSVDGRAEAEAALEWLIMPPNGGSAAILYRTNAQSREMEEACVKRGIRYTVVGALRFYERREVKDALAYFRLLSQAETPVEPNNLTQLAAVTTNAPDDLAFERAIGMPPRKVGKTSLDKLKEFANTHNITLYECSQYDELKQEFGGRWPKGLDTFITEINKRQTMIKDGIPAEKVIRQWIEQCGFIEHLKKEEDGDDRVGNVEELLNSFDRFRSEFPESGITAFLENVALVSDIDIADPKENVLALLTMHSAKGLEFDQVVVAGMEEGLFPLINEDSDAHDMEEERRLCYVAITRARKRLALSHAAFRARYGRTEPTSPSRFFNEIPISELEGDSFSIRKVAPPNTISRSVFVKHSASLPKLEKVPEIANPKSSTNGYQSGQRVNHPSFGVGKVINCVPSEGGYKVVVDFKTVGAKTILTKYVALTPVE